MSVVGIDVGGRKKGFHGCAIEGGAVVAGPTRLRTVAEAVEWVAARAPTTVARESPREPAAAGESSRRDEREFLAAGICHIRWTPERRKLRGPYYEWVLHGLELYAGLEQAVPAADLIEVFPTAAWTMWSGPKGAASRGSWSGAALDSLGLAGLSARRLDQDDRDAVAAALVAHLHERGETAAYGRIIVPARPLP
jgi:predicted nuclease with RNAse H fold